MNNKQNLLAKIFVNYETIEDPITFETQKKSEIINDPAVMETQFESEIDCNKITDGHNRFADLDNQNNHIQNSTHRFRLYQLFSENTYQERSPEKLYNEPELITKYMRPNIFQDLPTLKFHQSH